MWATHLGPRRLDALGNKKSRSTAGKRLPKLPKTSGRNCLAVGGPTFLGDLEIFEQMLHNRLFGLPPVEPSVFHRAGS
jgi:hypothetical protein